MTNRDSVCQISRPSDAAIKSCGGSRPKCRRVNIVSYLRTVLALVFGLFLHHLFTDSQVLGLVRIPLFERMSCALPIRQKYVTVRLIDVREKLDNKELIQGSNKK
jgi:hypothetical protein